MTAAEDIVRRMTERGLTLAIVECTTGGLMGHQVVSVPGASKVFVVGLASYGRKPKLDWLHVPTSVFEQYGSVHEETALALAKGAREQMGVDVAVAETGIASPTNNPERPGGLYGLAIAAEGYEQRERQIFPGDRVETMHAAVDRLSAMIFEFLDATKK